MTRFLIFQFLVIASCLGCSNPTSTQRTSLDRDKDIHDTLPYHIDTFYSFSPYFQQGEESLDTTYIRVIYPRFEDEAMRTLVERAFLEEGETLESFAESFLLGYDNYVEDALYPEHLQSWFSEIYLTIPLYTPRIIVLKNQIVEYTGGAHGNYATIYKNYVPGETEQIPLDALIRPEKKKEFSNIAQKIFREAEGLTEDDSLERDYFFDDGVFSLNENYAFDRGGILFHYNIYEIKAYAEGTTTFIIPYTQIMHTLTDYGKEIARDIQSNHQ